MPNRPRFSWLLAVALVLAFPVPASDPPEDQPVEVVPETTDELVSPPRVLAKSQKAPDYPPAALAARFSGTVHLRVTIQTDGTVGRVDVIECDHPNLGFEKASLDAVKKWKFSPAMKSDEPVEYTTSFRVNFRTASNGGQGRVDVLAGMSSTDAAAYERNSDSRTPPPPPPPSSARKQ
jgi:TonB family protein